MFCNCKIPLHLYSYVLFCLPFYIFCFLFFAENIISVLKREGECDTYLITTLILIYIFSYMPEISWPVSSLPNYNTVLLPANNSCSARQQVPVLSLRFWTFSLFKLYYLYTRELTMNKYFPTNSPCSLLYNFLKLNSTNT